MLNLEAKTKPQELILAYLEQNANEMLIEKINNGAQIDKDGNKLINKKTLDGFMTYANCEAKKLAEKGTNSACVEDTVVYGWAMHYFEEDSIEGTLYNLDGTPYKKPIPKSTYKPPIKQVVETPKPTRAQMSMFDTYIAEDKVKEVVKEKPTLDEILDYNIDENHDDDEDEETSEEMKIALEPKVAPFYQRYLDLQKEYPTAVILMRLGDFYEVFGNNAIILANELNMTLTSREVGLPERIPMIGLPYHAADTYFLKINHDMLVWENKGDVTFFSISEKEDEPEKHWIDNDGLIHEITKSIPEWLSRIFNNKIIAR